MSSTRNASYGVATQGAGVGLDAFEPQPTRATDCRGTPPPEPVGGVPDVLALLVPVEILVPAIDQVLPGGPVPPRPPLATNAGVRQIRSRPSRGAALQVEPLPCVPMQLVQIGSLLARPGSHGETRSGFPDNRPWRDGQNRTVQEAQRSCLLPIALFSESWIPFKILFRISSCSASRWIGRFSARDASMQMTTTEHSPRCSNAILTASSMSVVTQHSPRKPSWTTNNKNEFFNSLISFHRFRVYPNGAPGRRRPGGTMRVS